MFAILPQTSPPTHTHPQIYMQRIIHATLLLPPEAPGKRTSKLSHSSSPGGDWGASEGRAGAGRNPRVATAGVRHNARNATLPLINARHHFTASQSRSHLTRTFPCILAVSIRLFSFILPPPSYPPPSASNWGSLLLDRCCPLCPPGSAQAVSQPASQPVLQAASQLVSGWAYNPA